MSHLADARDIFRGVVASFFGFGGRLIARAVLVIFAGRAFGIEAFGNLGQVAAISEITAAICVLGLKRSLLDMLSFHQEQGIAPERRMMEALCLAGCVGCVLSGFLCIVWVQLFPNAENLIPFLFFSVPAIVITDVALTAIKFKRVIRWDVWARCIAEPWMFLFLAILLWNLGVKETGLIFAYAGSVLAACLCALMGLFKVVGFRPLMTAKPSIKSWPRIVRQSLPVGITDVGVMSIRRLDLILLGAIAGPAAAGLYYSAQQVVTVPQKINALFEPMLSPVMAKLHNQKNTVQIRENLMTVCRWIFIFQLAITVPLLVFSDDVMGLFGTDFRVGALILCILLLAELVDGTFISVETPLIYAKPKIPPTLLMLALVIEVASITIMSSIWGAHGAAFGFLITLSCLALARLFMLKKHLNISVLSKSYIIPMITGLIMAGALWALRDLQSTGPVVNVIGIVIALLLFAFIIKNFAMTKSDRTLIRALSRKRKRVVS